MVPLPLIQFRTVAKFGDVRDSPEIRGMIYQKLIFIHIPGTGGTSIEHSLGQTLENAEKYQTAREIQKKIGPEKFFRSFVFTFIRNPWDRIISLYHQPYYREEQGFGDKSLAYFIENFEPGPGEKKFYHEYLDADGITYIARFENRRQEILRISQVNEIPIDPSVHIGKTERDPDYRTYYDAETQQMVHEMFREDIDRYGYSF